MSVTSLGAPIAGGGNVYAWGEGQIIRLWGDGAPEGWVEHLGKMDCLSLRSGKSSRSMVSWGRSTSA